MASTQREDQREVWRHYVSLAFQCLSTDASFGTLKEMAAFVRMVSAVASDLVRHENSAVKTNFRYPEWSVLEKELKEEFGGNP